MRAFFRAIGISLLAIGSTAVAHTVSIGFAPAGTGSVSFWYGSYHTCTTPLTEGSLTLVGIGGNSFPSTTVPFSLTSCTKPSGLIDGTTNFYTADNAGGPLVAVPPASINCNPCSKWQGVTFTGLQAGQYRFTYVPIALPTQDWAPWDSTILSNTVTITGAQLGSTATIPTLGTPALVVLGIAVALAGLGFSSRRKS